MPREEKTISRTARWTLVSGACLLLGLGAGIWLGSRGMSWETGPEARAARKFQEFLGIVADEYVHPVAVDSLVEVTFNDVLGRLDPHSVYLPQSDALRLEEELAGAYDGIGMEYRWIRDTVAVVSVRGPARKKGLKPGDRLIAVDGVPVVGWSSDSLVGVLKGPAGSSVQVSVWSPRAKTVREVTVQRASIAVPSVRAARLDSGRVGYLRIERFGEHTPEEVRSFLRQAKRERLSGVVVDLRGNGGGFLASGVAAADEFLSAGKTVVWTVGRSGPPERTVATAGGSFEKGAVVVLVDGETASAAEIFAAALQDHRRALLVGKNTFGKGLVQDERVLRDGSRLRLTTAVYLTPKKKNIQRLGKGAAGEGKGGLRPNVELSSDTLYGPHWLGSIRQLEVFDRLTFSWAEQDRGRTQEVWVTDERLWEFLAEAGLEEAVASMTEQDVEWIRFALTLEQIRFQRGAQASLELQLTRDYAVDAALALLKRTRP